MKLKAVRVSNYRSIKDTGWVDVETLKTILVGPNEAGKTVFLRAMQQLNPPSDAPQYDPLRDFPRADYNQIQTGQVDPNKSNFVEGIFELEEAEKKSLPPEFNSCKYHCGRYMSNEFWNRLEDAPEPPNLGDITSDLVRLAAHADKQYNAEPESEQQKNKFSNQIKALREKYPDDSAVIEECAVSIKAWLEEALPHIDESNVKEVKRHEALTAKAGIKDQRNNIVSSLKKRLPIFVLYSNYFRVRPIFHLRHLADRSEKGLLDDDQYDYGNLCLLKLLGFTARQLSDLGSTAEPINKNDESWNNYRSKLDGRSYQLNAAGVRLTNEIRNIWNPDKDKSEANTLRIIADGQYLKVVVVDELGVEVELDQRSEGLQWLVSFFIVFFAEADDQNNNAILLLDEPGLSLHALKQREFRNTITRLAEKNQTIFSTHSPFLVGPDELDFVRVVEMKDRINGTKVHTSLTAEDPAALLPLQEAFGYDLAQSLFAQQNNLVLEGLTDYWYVDATAQLLRAAKITNLNEKIALVPAHGAGKVVYYATILHSQKLKVAALLDSDAAGDQAASQNTLVNTLGNKRILRTKDSYKGQVAKPEIEDLLRDTLISIAKVEFGTDVSADANLQKSRSITDLLSEKVNSFSKYKLAKAYLRWTRDHEAKDLKKHELTAWVDLIDRVGRALK
jgi:predicted ATP-binding protein involved in virulence